MTAKPPEDDILPLGALVAMAALSFALLVLAAISVVIFADDPCEDSSSQDNIGSYTYDECWRQPS